LARRPRRSRPKPTRIDDVLSAGIDDVLAEFDITTSPLGRTAYSTQVAVSARGPVDGIAQAGPRWA
jgi:hypothetical protein